ncbi:hypothetical protein EVAR_4908_1 [Eumeta japonica]|uniref:Uncharacterized protein n=1 Tax=Eumeta variegata TaxID=151549 RepID=A0A4C1Y168_EUMVA|nr:hypothetical protein EVAR_4908_1 [Eumeta japonica]
MLHWSSHPERMNESRLTEQIYRAYLCDGKIDKGYPRKSYADRTDGMSLYYCCLRFSWLDNGSDDNILPLPQVDSRARRMLVPIELLHRDSSGKRGGGELSYFYGHTNKKLKLPLDFELGMIPLRLYRKELLKIIL